MKKTIVFLLLFPLLLYGGQSMEELIEALEIARYWDEKLEERFPVTFNHTLSTGYFTTHSARMTDEGEFGFGVARVPPYLNWNARLQPFSHLELGASYRIFQGVDDPLLSPHGFGDYADRGANFKVALITPEQTFYTLPGIAFGVDDFMGTKKFLTYYVVGTQVLINYGLEGSFGWGAGRYTHGPSRGFFGGINWFPWFRCPNKWLKGICLSAEYDPVNYKDPAREPHPDGRVSHSPINFGAKYTFGNLFELSASQVRGDAFAVAGSVHYNWGKTSGFLPKIGDPLPYDAPIDTEPLGCSRPEEVMIQTINYALEEQGFQLTNAWIERCEEACGLYRTRLWIQLINCRYREEHVVKMRLEHLFASLTPSNVADVVVILESYGVPCQQYVFNRAHLIRASNGLIGPFELDVLTPRQEACKPNTAFFQRIFHRRYDLWKGRISPRYETFFGSAAGKFKYDFGIKGELEGFLPYNWYYEFQASYTPFSNIHKIGDFDLFHPSQLPIVATDYVRYRQEGMFSWDKLYLQKSWNFGCGVFGRVAGGYFQVNYGGVAAELLWYPTCSNFAIGLEGAIVKKRTFSGLGFQSTLKQLKGFTPTFHSYFALEQYFLDFYYDFQCFHIFTKVSVGQFLARDKGVRLEATRYFDNGIRITGWITFTDAGDKMHGETFFNRGVALEMPFDFFFKCSSRRVWSTGMAAWLRDAGYSTSTGRPLFEMINRERRW